MKKFVIITALFLSACGTVATKPVADTELCIGCATEKDVKLGIAELPPLNLQEFKSIKFQLTESTATMSTQDYVLLQNLLAVLEGRISLLESQLFAYREFYERK